MRICLTRRQAVSLLVLMAAGCGSSSDKWSKDRPAVFRVSGTVLLDGEPVEAANVNFVPSVGTHAAYALTDEQGNFQLSTFQQGDGAPGGKYQVTVRKTVQESTPNPQGPDFPALVVKETAIVPEKYSNPETSGLVAEVTDGGISDLKFELKK